MTKKELGTLVSKVFGLVYLTKAINWLAASGSSLVFYKSYEENAVYIIASNFIMLAAFTLLASTFWFASGRIGRLIAGGEPEKPVLQISETSLMAAVFLAFGCYLLTYAIPVAADLIAENFKPIPVHPASLTRKWVELLLFVFLSLLFILGANGMRNLICKLRGSNES